MSLYSRNSNVKERMGWCVKEDRVGQGLVRREGEMLIKADLQDFMRDYIKNNNSAIQINQVKINIREQSYKQHHLPNSQIPNNMRSAAMRHQRNQSHTNARSPLAQSGHHHHNLQLIPVQSQTSYPLGPLSHSTKAISNVATIQWKFGQEKRAAKDHRNLFSYLQSNKDSRQALIEGIFKSKDAEFQNTMEKEITQNLIPKQNNSVTEGRKKRNQDYAEERRIFEMEMEAKIDQTLDQQGEKTDNIDGMPTVSESTENPDLILRMMQTGTNFNTQELEDILKSFKKNHTQQTAERENRNAPINISQTTKNVLSTAVPAYKIGSRSEQSLDPNNHQQRRYAPTEIDAVSSPSFQYTPSLPMFPDIVIPKKHKPGNKLLSDDRKVLGMQRLKVQMINFKRQLQKIKQMHEQQEKLKDHLAGGPSFQFALNEDSLISVDVPSPGMTEAHSLQKINIHSKEDHLSDSRSNHKYFSFNVHKLSQQEKSLDGLSTTNSRSRLKHYTHGSMGTGASPSQRGAMPVEGKLLGEGKPPLPTLQKYAQSSTGSFKFNNLSTFQHDVLERDKIRGQIRDIKNNKFKIKNYMESSYQHQTVSNQVVSDPSISPPTILENISKKGNGESSVQIIDQKIPAKNLSKLQKNVHHKNPVHHKNQLEDSPTPPLPRLLNEMSTNSLLPNIKSLEKLPTITNNNSVINHMPSVRTLLGNGGGTTTSKRSPKQMPSFLKNQQSNYQSQKEASINKQKELDDQIDRIIADQLDENFKNTFGVDVNASSSPNTQMQNTAKNFTNQNSVDDPLFEQMKNQYQLQLDGFNFQESPTKIQKELIASQKLKTGHYDLDPNDKLKQKGYNLFKEVTQHTVSQMSPLKNMAGIPRSLQRIDPTVIKRGKNSEFFKEFKAQHKNTIDSQLKIIQEVFGDDSMLIRQCKELVYSTSPHKEQKHFLRRVSPHSSVVHSPNLLSNLSPQRESPPRKESGESAVTLKKSAKKAKMFSGSGSYGSFELHTIKEEIALH
ncbi:hypothetical protein FGO68_gene12809 [Halteria grandinella]|uniref:Uncharacterized protein n=1 Tax=Halteria grandinella TaxID=5974 RepID=A0A8J8P509_HALGN|nr:hypothetical protein FGO68_gene12809 [Halteria grandinella]